MGFQDRGYSRSPSAGFAGEWSAVNTIIATTVAVWLANFILAGDLFREFFPLRISLNELAGLRSDLLDRPWNAWQLLSYGFLHDDRTPWHIVFNMLTLWFFGRPVEGIVGRAEFFRFYAAAIVVAGLAWVIGELLLGGGGRLIGASGGVMAVLAAFIWYYPRETVLIYGVLPVPAWALGLLYLFSDLQGAGQRTTDVAHVAHLAGAAFGVLYAWRRLDLSSLTDWPGQLLARLRRRGLRVVRPEDEPGGDIGELPLDREVDRILEKISRSGEASLTPAERDALTRASRRLKGRRG